MILTDRDKKLLLDLTSYALLTTKVIQARYFQNVAVTTVLRRLRRLEDHGYIQRIHGLENAQLAWGLTNLGAEQFPEKISKIHFSRSTLDHDLKLMALRLKLEAQGISKSWRPEHEIRALVAKKNNQKGLSDRIIPDALMGIETQGFKESVAIELELSPKNQSRYRNIFGQYQYKSSLWGLWYVVGSNSIGRQLEKAAKDSGFYTKRPIFLWSNINDVLSDPANAALKTRDRKYLLKDLWEINPAHTPAQGMSRENEKINAEENGLSTGNEEKTLAPTG